MGHDNICPGLPGAPELWCYASNSFRFAMHKQVVSHILTQGLSIAYTVLLPNGIGKNAVVYQL